MAEGGEGDRIDILAGDVVAAVEEGACAGGGEHGLAGAWRGTVADEVVDGFCGAFAWVGAAYDFDEVVLHLRGTGDVAKGFSHPDNVGSVGDWLDVRAGVSAGAVEDLAELIVGW